MSNSRRKASKRAVEGQGAMSRPKPGKRGRKATRAPLKADGKMEVRVTCRGADTAALADLNPFQGDLKKELSLRYRLVYNLGHEIISDNVPDFWLSK